jgi:hypothetical protein
MGLLARLDGDVAGAELSKIRGFEIIFALVICAEYWTKALARRGELAPAEVVALVPATVLAAATLVGFRRRTVFAGFALLQAWYVWTNFPVTGNHRFLELVVAVLLAILSPGVEQERRLLFRSLRFTVLVVLFFSGLQKLIHGYYLRGQFLAYSLSRDSFHVALAPLLPAGEADRLRALGDLPGAGPYLVESPAFLIVSNAVWIAEIGLAFLLVHRATRRFAWIAACLFVVATELVAREFMFGIEFVATLALFARDDVVRRFVAPVAAVLTALVLIRLGLLPEVTFH